MARALACNGVEARLREPMVAASILGVATTPATRLPESDPVSHAQGRFEVRDLPPFAA